MLAQENLNPSSSHNTVTMLPTHLRGSKVMPCHTISAASNNFEDPAFDQCQLMFLTD